MYPVQLTTFITRDMYRVHNLPLGLIKIVEVMQYVIAEMVGNKQGSRRTLELTFFFNFPDHTTSEFFYSKPNLPSQYSFNKIISR